MAVNKNILRTLKSFRLKTGIVFVFFPYNNEIHINQKKNKTYNSAPTTLCVPGENQDYKE